MKKKKKKKKKAKTDKKKTCEIYKSSHLEDSTFQTKTSTDNQQEQFSIWQTRRFLPTLWYYQLQKLLSIPRSFASNQPHPIPPTESAKLTFL